MFGATEAPYRCANRPDLRRLRFLLSTMSARRGTEWQEVRARPPSSTANTTECSDGELYCVGSTAQWDATFEQQWGVRLTDRRNPFDVAREMARLVCALAKNSAGS
jgi:hypothetical protein